MASNAWPGQLKGWDTETGDFRDRNQPRLKAKVLALLSQSPWLVVTGVGAVVVTLVIAFMSSSAVEIPSESVAPNGGSTGGRHQWRLKPFRDAKIEEEQDTSATDCEPHGNADHSEFCSYVENTPSCTEGDQFLHYLSFHYCVMEGYPLISTAILFGWAMLMFYVLSEVADRFFCPALENIADLLGLPADVAGATLLSFGNGAPDVFTQIAATSGGENGDVDLAVGSVLGAGLFICSAVLAMVALLTPSIAVVVKRIFLRDVIFYLAATLLFVYIMSSSAVLPWHTFALIVLYVAYLTYAVLGNRIHGSLAGEEEPPATMSASPSPGFANKAGTTPGLANRLTTLSSPFSKGSNTTEAVTRPLISPPSSSDRPAHLLVQPHPQRSHHHHHERQEGRDAGMCLPWCGMLLAWVREESGWDEKSGLRKLLVPFTLPMLFLMRATMPEVGSDHYPRPFAVVLPAGAPLFFLVVEGIQLGQLQMFLGASISLGLCGYMLANYPATGEGAPSTGVTKAFSIVAFLQAIVWMDVAAGELVALFKAFGTIFSVSQVFLGATILAWGNSVGDLVANSAVARSGRTTMALTACFAGPLFNVLAGMSISLFLMTGVNNTVPLKPMAGNMVTLFAFQIVLLVSMLVFVPTVCAWKISRRMGVMLLMFYAVFTVVYVSMDLLG